MQDLGMGSLWAVVLLCHRD